jgi:Protein of unknown function (DUF2971)
MPEQVSAEWLEAFNKIGKGAHEVLMAAKDWCPYPDCLYHFTDCRALVEILKSRSLWATLAAALSDPSETQYCMSRVAGMVEHDRFDVVHLPLRRVLEMLRTRVEWRSYVISFCGREDTALHWLHYGHSGSGVAIGFEPRKLDVRPYLLYPVLYEQDQQDAFIRDLLEGIDKILSESFNRLEPREQASLIEIAAEAAANYLWLAGPLIKNPCFTAEEEWRLVTYEPKGEGFPEKTKVTSPTEFRESAGRVVPYKKVNFGVLPATSIVLGACAPIEPTELPLVVLMEETIGARLEVRRSDVPVRS